MAESVEYYDSEKLIAEVEKRPTLYDKNVKEYNDKFVREKLWKEVCEAVIPNWTELTVHNKEKTARDVQRKWKNIRDCFRKELNHQKRWKAGYGKRKRRKYVFYDQLLFLLPTIRERERKYESAQSSGEEVDENIEETTTFADQSEKTSYKPPLWKHKGRMHPVYPNEEPSMQILQDRESEEIDEDKYFLLSLVPSFRNLTPDKKFSAKIEILKMLLDLSYPTSSAAPTDRNDGSSEEPHTSFEQRTDDVIDVVENPKKENDYF